MAERSEAGTLFVELRGGRHPVRPHVPRSEAYELAIARVHRLGQIPEGWDSYGGHAVSPGARQQALMFITSLLAHVDREQQPPAPEVGPIAEGGVLLRWLTAEREIELAFFASGGEYTVRDRKTGNVIDEGEIGRPESLLRDVFKEHFAQ